MDELTKALGPWPVLQFTLGAIIFLGSAYMVFRGITGAKNNPAPAPPTGSPEEEMARWRAYERLENIEEQVFKLAEQQRVQIDLTRQLVHLEHQNLDAFRNLATVFHQLRDAIWNRAHH